jgi:hypothetical protein
MRGEAPKMRTGRGFQLLVICLLSLVVIAAGYDGVFGYLLREHIRTEKLFYVLPCLRVGHCWPFAYSQL